MMLGRFLAAALTSTVLSAPAYASAVYEFTFDNTANGGGTVHGTVTLPSSADGTYPASSVVVTSNTAGFGLGEYVGNAADNSFVISEGNITDASVFLAFGSQNSSPAVVCCSLTLGDQSGTGSVRAGLTDSRDQVSAAQVRVTFTLQAPLRAALPTRWFLSYDHYSNCVSASPRYLSIVLQVHARHADATDNFAINDDRDTAFHGLCLWRSHYLLA
jgi:hypothetical protein